MAWIKLNATNPAAPAGAAQGHWKKGTQSGASEADPIETSVHILPADESNPGCLPALSGEADQFLNGVGEWVTPPGGDPDEPVIFEDFLGGVVTHSLGWVANAQNGGASVVAPNNPGAFGVHRLTTSTSSSAYAYLILGLSDTGGEAFNPTTMSFKITARVRTSKTASNDGGVCRFGLVSNRGVQNPGTYIYLEAATANSSINWFAKQRNGSGTEGSADTGVSAHNLDWHTLEIECSGTNQAIFRIDGSQVAASLTTTNFPNAALTIVFEAAGDGTAAQFDMDYFRLELTR